MSNSLTHNRHDHQEVPGRSSKTTSFSPATAIASTTTSFAQQGAKIGSTLRIRLPDRALVTDGAALNVQDDQEQYTTLTVASQKHIGINFTTAELTMQLDDFAERVLKPRVSQLASSVDADVASVYSSIYNSVGTPGTTPATSLVLLQGQQKLSEFATPMSERYATVNPAANAGLVEGMKGLFNAAPTISKQFNSGMMGTGVLGYDEINMSQSINTFTTGTRSTSDTIITAQTLSTQGASTINMSGGTGSATIKAGDGNVHDCRLLCGQPADAALDRFLAAVRLHGAEHGLGWNVDGSCVQPADLHSGRMLWRPWIRSRRRPRRLRSSALVRTVYPRRT